MKVELDYDHKIDSVDFVDQLVKARLTHMRDSLKSWDSDLDIVVACQTIIDYINAPGIS